MKNELETDRIETLQDAIIQHGPLSNRIYLMHLGEVNPEQIIDVLNNIAVAQGYTKIFVKIPSKKADAFLNHGYRIEAAIPLFYRFQDEAVFLAKYLSTDRAELKQAEQIYACLQLACSHASGRSKPAPLPPGAHIHKCTLEDAEDMSIFYQSIFTTYPFPIHDPVYIRKTMQNNVKYYAIKLSSRLIALSSAEMSPSFRNAEMTDFATAPAWRGHGLAVCLLARMEQDMVLYNITTAYTIARSLSAGINITFARMGYHYGGTLNNNTNIGGQIESMNVWLKHLV